VKLKLDENVDLRVISFLRLAGHDVATVQGQGLSSAPDVEVINVCRSESRCLVTSDRGFGNRMRFNPPDYAGIVVIRLPPRPTFEVWREAIENLILGLEQAEVEGKLWIIQQGNIQEYQPIEREDAES
jgi:predicted nuclease of predicted toxin-antitoxin system